MINLKGDLLTKLLLVWVFACASTDRADELCLARPVLDIAPETSGNSIELSLTLKFEESARIYLHERFGLEEQLGGYLKILFESTEGEVLELASWSPKTKYPSRKQLMTLMAGEQITAVFTIAPVSTFYFRADGGWRESLPPGDYLVNATYVVPDDSISRRLGLDSISSRADTKELLWSPQVERIDIVALLGGKCPALSAMLEDQKSLIEKMQGKFATYLSAALKCRGCGGCDLFRNLELDSSDCASLANQERDIRRSIQEFLRHHEATSSFLIYGEVAYFIEELIPEDNHWLEIQEIANWESYKGAYRLHRRRHDRAATQEADVSVLDDVVVVGLPVFDDEGFIGAFYVTYPRELCMGVSTPRD